MSSPNPHAIDADTLSGMKPLRKVVYSIGSNLGDRLGNLQGAVDALRDTPDVIVVDVSSVYETDPVDAPEDSPQFLNMVVVAETTLEPRTLLERALAIEDAFGRERGPEQYAPAHPRRRSDHGRQHRLRRRGSAAAAPAGARTRVRPRPVATRSTPRASSPVVARSPTCSRRWAPTAWSAATTSWSKATERAVDEQ